MHRMKFGSHENFPLSSMHILHERQLLYVERQLLCVERQQYIEWQLLIVSNECLFPAEN